VTVGCNATLIVAAVLHKEEIREILFENNIFHALPRIHLKICNLSTNFAGRVQRPQRPECFDICKKASTLQRFIHQKRRFARMEASL
jgi:hypothetical protein